MWILARQRIGTFPTISMSTLSLRAQGHDDDTQYAIFFLGIAAFFLVATTIAVYWYSSAVA